MPTIWDQIPDVGTALRAFAHPTKTHALVPAIRDPGGSRHALRPVNLSLGRAIHGVITPHLRAMARGPSSPHIRSHVALQRSNEWKPKNVRDPFNCRPASEDEETRRLAWDFHRPVGGDRMLSRSSRRHCNPSRTRRPLTVGHRPRAFPDRSGGPRLHPTEDMTMASPAALCSATGPRANGRERGGYLASS